VARTHRSVRVDPDLLAELDDLVSDDAPPRGLAEAIKQAGVMLHLAASDGPRPEPAISKEP
jgi:hypothetical protein